MTQPRGSPLADAIRPYRHRPTPHVKGKAVLASNAKLGYPDDMNRSAAFRTPLRFTLSLACLALAGVSSLSGPALAQGGGAIPSQSLAATTNRRAPAALPSKAPAPPALPGAQSTGAAPSARVPLDMPPTEALFDGVNRGDIEAVRDALSRGAELNAHNILGITATELAIDLGRNDIAFLLLSMRNAEKPRAGQRQGTTATRTAPPPAPRPAPQQRVAVTRNEPTVQRSFPNTPGAPAPSAGFLGFDERHIAR